MASAAMEQERSAPTAPAPGRDSFGSFAELVLGGWTVRRYGTVSSTQDIAAGRPAWTAVAADIQTAGRGQRERSFTSDRGGLYVTAVVPFDGDAALWRGFALAVGWTIVSTFRVQGIARLRLRWPNDLMSGARKVGGILVSQGGPDTLCVGLGLNVSNRPWTEDPGLEARSGRLADLAPAGRLAFEPLATALLGAVQLAHASFSLRGLGGFSGRLNRCWGGPRNVSLELAPGGQAPGLRGLFRGILPNGDLVIEDDRGGRTVVRSHLVRRLEEC
jgi:BirA family biotin operon repressor/biotin-[acetyl-CoA-carboxylase] ligase